MDTLHFGKIGLYNISLFKNYVFSVSYMTVGFNIMC